MKQLAELCDLYVNDAFGTAHRAHASTEGLARLLGKERSAAGLLLLREVEAARSRRSSRKWMRFTAQLSTLEDDLVVGIDNCRSRASQP